ncbi:MAG: type II toxin-antitoxin system HicB family antitoxin [Myxococcota bacterium]
MRTVGEDYVLSRVREGGWEAESRIFTGCAARGATREEAVCTLREAVACLLASLADGACVTCLATPEPTVSDCLLSGGP